MTARTKAILEECLDLPEKDRADLAGRLILSLHPKADRDVDAAWSAEIDRRLENFESGKARSVLWTKVKQAIIRTQRARARRKAIS